MKKVVVLATALLLLAALGLSALAEGTWVLYVNAKTLKVYEQPDEESKVLKKLKGGAKQLIEMQTDDGIWYGILVEASGGDGQTLGYVLAEYMSDTMPQKYCKHKYGKWKVTKEATCTEKGQRQRTCKVCGKVEKEEIKKAKHEYGKWKVTKEATCTEVGQRQRTCKVCGKVAKEEIEKAKHDFSKWKVTKEATCTEKGERQRKCKVCGKVEKEEVKKVPHAYGEWEVTKKASCTETGERVRKCTVCGHEDRQTLDKLPHDYAWETTLEATDHSSGRRAQVCRVCGHAEPEQSYDPEGTLRRRDRGDDVRALQQLLVDQGYLNEGGADGVFGGGTERALIQFQQDQGLEPDGVAWPQTQKRLDHDFGEWELVRPVTRSEAGERVRVCKDCGYEQHETVEGGDAIDFGARGENVRAIQQLLNALGFDAGKADGIYGKKLDSAFAAFAGANGRAFEAGRVLPGDVDALVSAWLAALPEAQWKGEGTGDSPVNLILTVSLTGDDSQAGGMSTYDWMLTNLGSEPCRFDALLLNYGGNPGAGQDNLALLVGGDALEAGAANNLSGSISVAADWGEGSLNFAAIAASEGDGAEWISNTVSFEGAAAEAAPAKTVAPQPASVDLAALQDGIYPVSFDRADIRSDESGVVIDSVSVYTLDTYDIVDMSTLAEGDTIVADGRTFAVNTVERLDNGILQVNGGWDWPDGCAFAARDEDNCFVALMDDDYATYTNHGAIALTLDPSAVYEDAWDIDAEPVTADYDGIVDAIMASENDSFTPYNTTVRIEAGKVVEIDRSYMP